MMLAELIHLLGNKYFYNMSTKSTTSYTININFQDFFDVTSTGRYGTLRTVPENIYTVNSYIGLQPYCIVKSYSPLYHKVVNKDYFVTQ